MANKSLEEEERRSCRALSMSIAAVAAVRFVDLNILPAVLPLLSMRCERQRVQYSARGLFEGTGGEGWWRSGLGSVRYFGK